VLDQVEIAGGDAESFGELFLGESVGRAQGAEAGAEAGRLETWSGHLYKN
jgi:hypothetical protein